MIESLLYNSRVSRPHREVVGTIGFIWMKIDYYSLVSLSSVLQLEDKVSQIERNQPTDKIS
jgi:hypothetical protein